MHYGLLIQPQGPIIVAEIWISAPRRLAMTAAGQAWPRIVTAHLLIDTGASCTCIDPTVIAQLGIQPTGATQISTPSTGATPHQCNLYDIGLKLPGPTPAKVFDAIPVIESSLASQGIHGLLGRDVLAESRLVYSGVDGFLMLSF